MATRHAWLSRAFVTAFLALLALASWRAGVRIRDDVWTTTRTIRFNGDIANAMHWGNRVLRTAQATSGYVSTAAATGHEPTLWEIVRGEGEVYSNLTHGWNWGDYQLDYPPLRLLAMTLWVRSVQRQFPELTEWPGNPAPQRGGGWFVWAGQGRGLARGPTEDIAAPLLRANTICEAASALLAFALVWLWVDRGARQPIRCRASTPLRHAASLIVFSTTLAAFSYAAAVALAPAPSPPPALAVTAQPVVLQQGQASVFAWIDPQGADTRWHVEWSQQATGFEHRGSEQTILAGRGATFVTARMQDLPLQAPIRYRVVARNDPARQNLKNNLNLDLGRGTTAAPEQTLIVKPGIVQPAIIGGVAGRVWLSAWQWAGVAMLFIMMCVALRQLPCEHRGWAAGAVAAVFIWFDPSLILDSHAWPQWDSWVLPPFLAAALLVSFDWWFAAGLVLGVGGMIKGQVWLGSPVLLAWPLLSAQWGKAVRLCVGTSLSAGIVVSPWIILNNQTPVWSSAAFRWIAAVLVAAAGSSGLALYRPAVMRHAWHLLERGRLRFRRRLPKVLRRGTAFESDGRPSPSSSVPSRGTIITFAVVGVATIIFVALLVLGPWPSRPGLSPRWGAALAIALLLIPWTLRPSATMLWLAAVCSAAIWASGVIFRGNWSWEAVGYDYGTRKWAHLGISGGNGGGNNLGTILAERFGWQTHDILLRIRLPNIASAFCVGGYAPRFLHALYLDGSILLLDVKQTMLLVYGICVALSGAAAALHARRRDPRVLAALVAPWVLMPNLLAQMMNRYEMWGAVLSAILIALSCELGVLHVLLSLLASGMIGAQLLQSDPQRSPGLDHLMAGLAPTEAGLLLLCGAIILAIAIAPLLDLNWSARFSNVPRTATAPAGGLREGGGGKRVRHQAAPEHKRQPADAAAADHR